MITPSAETSERLDWMLHDGQVNDENLLQALTHQYYAPLYALAFFLTGNPDAARNAAHKALLSGVFWRHRYSGESGLLVWLDHYLLEACPRPWNDPYHDDLGPDTRLLLFLRYVHGLVSVEIAKLMELSPKAVQASLGVARQSLPLEAGEELAFPEASPEPGCQPFSDSLQSMLNYRPAQEAVRLTNQLSSAGDNHQSRVDGLPPSADLDALLAHLAVCDACRQRERALGLLEYRMATIYTRRWVNRSFAEAELQEQATQAIDDLKAHLSRRRISLLTKQGAVIAAALVLVSIMAFFSNYRLSDGKLIRISLPTKLVVYIIEITATPNGTEVAQSVQSTMAADPSPTPTFGWPPPTAPARNSLSEAARSMGGIDLSPSAPFSETLPAGLGWNNSGPLALDVILHHWGEKGSSLSTLQPNTFDETVMPYEILDYIAGKTSLRAIYRLGGDPYILESLVIDGFPVLIQTGYEDPQTDGWISRYEIVNGYNDKSGRFSIVVFDPETHSYMVESASRDDFQNNVSGSAAQGNEAISSWMPFDFGYIVIYPAEKEIQVQNAIDQQFDATSNYRNTLGKNLLDTQYQGSVLFNFYAWFNYGTTLTYLTDYSGAAQAYDQAFYYFNRFSPYSQIQKPWRMLWYQTRPYWAYYYTGNFNQTKELANEAISHDGYALEESYYWRAMAEKGQGDLLGAGDDLRKSLEINPNFAAGKSELEKLLGNPLGTAP